MRRAWRIALTTAGIACGYLIGRGVLAWFAERRRREVFPAEQSDALLNPLRSRLMPARKTLERFQLTEGHTVLEVGPGPGFFTVEASRIVGPAGRIICLDLQRGMIERLNARLAEADVRNADALVGDAMRLPLRDASVNRAFLVTVLGEIPDMPAALGELRRVLVPGGVLAIDETLRDPDYVRLSTLREMCAAAGLEEAAYHRSPLGYTACFRRA